MFSQPDRSAADRILWAAIDLFGRQGIKATTFRSISEQAGVSQALVVHHFRSKEGLQDACDRRVVDFVRQSKTDAVDQGASVFPLSIDARVKESQPVLRYLARVLVEGSPRLDVLLDEIVDDALVYTKDAEAAGWMKPSSDPRARIVVLTVWSFGALVLNDQLRRMLGADLLSGDGDVLSYVRPAIEIFKGILTEDAFTELHTDVEGAGAAGPEGGTA